MLKLAYRPIGMSSPTGFWCFLLFQQSKNKTLKNHLILDFQPYQGFTLCSILKKVHPDFLIKSQFSQGNYGKCLHFSQFLQKYTKLGSHLKNSNKMKNRILGSSKSAGPYILSNKIIIGRKIKLFGEKLLLKATGTF